MNSPVRLGVSPAAFSSPTGVFSQWFEALFPCPGTLGCVVCHWVHQLLPCPPWSSSHRLAQVLSAQLPVSTPPTGLDECVFFNSLVVGLPYSSIFCQFLLFFVFKLSLSFFWLCKDAQCVYLCLHLGQKSSEQVFNSYSA